MNPLKLNRACRKFYNALIERDATDFRDKDAWLAAYRKVKLIYKAEGANVLEGFRCYHTNSDHPFPWALAKETFLKGL